MNPTRSLLTRSLLTAAALFLAGCASTKLASSWKAPEAGTIHFTKILVMAVAPVDSLRHPAEDAMRAQIKTVPVVTSYELLPKAEDGSDPVKLDAAIKAAGVDGIIVMRMVSSDSEVGYTTGGMMPSYYTSFNSYYSYNFPGYHNYYNNRFAAQASFYYDPPKMYVDQIVGIETNIYNARDQALIWTGITKSTNPDGIDKLIAEVSDVVRNKLRSQGLIK
jgi:hypothetical protein